MRSSKIHLAVLGLALLLAPSALAIFEDSGQEKEIIRISSRGMTREKVKTDDAPRMSARAYAAALRAEHNGKLEARTIELDLPRDDEVPQEQRRRYAAQLEEAVKTQLHAKGGIATARAQGRKIWFDEKTMQMTVVDTPENLRRVSDYVSSIPELERRGRSRVIYLKHADAAELAAKLNVALGVESGAGTTRRSGDSIVMTLRVEDELTFRELSIRLVRVNENDANDENDDSVELVIRTNTDSRDATIEEFRSEFVDDYEIYVRDVDPSSTRAGEGRARIEVRYRPQQQ